ncbi:MAG: orotate phosphoribosyltransferase [Nitrospirae bacterium]|nr:MAG: orotate phosphoribosyltransferase [Nitrospirota bacterium]
MNNLKQRLIELIRQRAFLYSEKEEFVLASGKRSKYYFNLKKVLYNPEALYIVGKLGYEKIQSLGLRPTHVGGLTLGADPVALAIARYSYDAGEPIEAFVVRKEPKGHGSMSQIEGYIEKGAKVVIVEDVLTTGGSAMKAIDVALSAELEVLGLLAVLDRQEGGRENIQARGIPVHCLLTIRDFIP